MRVTLVTDSPVHCTNGKGGTLRRIAIDPQTKRVDYIEVHRGRIFTHDHCVPASRIREATAEAVTLNLSTHELDALGAVEAKNPTTGFYQRCIPDSYINLAKTRIEDRAGQVVGHCYGVETGPERQVEFLLTGRAERERIPITAVTTLDEDRIIVEPQTSTPRGEQAATSDAGGYSASTQQVLRFLQAHPAGGAVRAAGLCASPDTDGTGASGRGRPDQPAADGQRQRRLCVSQALGPSCAQHPGCTQA